MPVTTRSQANKQLQANKQPQANKQLQANKQPQANKQQETTEVFVQPQAEANIYNSNGYTNLMNAVTKCDLNLVERYLSEPKTHVNDSEDIFTRYGYFATKHMNPSNTLDIARGTLYMYKRFYSVLYKIKNENRSNLSLNGKFLNALKNNNVDAFLEIINVNYKDIKFYNEKNIDGIDDLINQPLLNVNVYKPLELALEMAKKSKIIYDLLVNAGARHSIYRE